MVKENWVASKFKNWSINLKYPISIVAFTIKCIFLYQSDVGKCIHHVSICFSNRNYCTFYETKRQNKVDSSNTYKIYLKKCCFVCLFLESQIIQVHQECNTKKLFIRQPVSAHPLKQFLLSRAVPLATTAGKNKTLFNPSCAERIGRTDWMKLNLVTVPEKKNHTIWLISPST